MYAGSAGKSRVWLKGKLDTWGAGSWLRMVFRSFLNLGRELRVNDTFSRDPEGYKGDKWPQSRGKRWG